MHGQTLQLPLFKRIFFYFSMRCGWPATNTLQRQTLKLTDAFMFVNIDTRDARHKLECLSLAGLPE